MRIDAHQHFWRYDPAEYEWIDESMTVLRRDFMPAHLEGELKKNGFDGSVAVQARQTLEETRFLLALADAHPFILGVVGWVELVSPDIEKQLDQLARHRKLVGVRHIVQGEPDDRFVLREDFCRGIAALEPLGLTYDILVYPRQLPAAIEFAARFPRQPFVLDHLAKPNIRERQIRGWESDFRQLAARPNVFCKLSGMVTEADWQQWHPEQLRPYLDVAFDCFGADRLMIGSDWPVCTLAADYTRTMGLVIEYLNERPAHEREAVLGGTAQRFWNLSARVAQAFRPAHEDNRKI